jgi:hypothetical protein
VNARRARRGLVQLVALADPTPRLAARRLTAPAPPIRVVSIYRRRNAATLLELLGPALGAGGAVALWALDEQAPRLARWTAGSGPGTRFALANRLLADRPASWCVLADDDVRFRHGDVVQLVRFAHALGLDLAQPAHALGSHVSHSFTRRAPFRVARRTSFVEIGPVVAFSPRALPHVLPLPETGMGWGVEADWAGLEERAGLRLGIVDAVTIRHLEPPGGGYASDEELEAALARLRAAGKRGYGDLQRTHARLGLRSLDD